ncbi:CoA transferase subunit A [Pseudonocardia acaciae]|uniref:CoA transferase subunit A n=1 Tax=Pseudonocardia acaciae TaxID=551276 RepID=UPI00048A6F02|nr:3-oxoacid CoA-transferase subunit A [Pseudonocardia acaciae]
MINKVVESAAKAVADIESGAMIAFGGFVGVPGVPSTLIKAISERNLRDLTIIACESGRGRAGSQNYGTRNRRAGQVTIPEPEDGVYPVGYLAELGQVRKAISTFSAGGPLEDGVRRGDVEIELIGQGSLMERLRCGRAGIAAFYTPVGAGTKIGIGKDVRHFDGVPHILETALHPDFAIVAAHQADRFGNLVYRHGARTTNPVVAGSAKVTIAEVEEIVDYLDPNHIVTPGPYVDRIVRSSESLMVRGRDK